MAKNKKKNTVLQKELPEAFLDRLKIIVGPSLMHDVRKTFVEKPTTFRVNTIRATRDDIKEQLQREGFKIKQVSWYSDAFILLNKTKRELTDLPMYNEGKIYIQSLASMVPPLVMNPQPGEKILDLTAAPGSKTSQIAALMNKQGVLVANELNKVRFFKLKHNMESLGVSDADDNWKFVLRMEDGSVLTQEYLEYFDKVLLDAPCGGEARFIEGNPKSYGYWNEKKIKRLAFTQHKLLLACWSALKPGGELVYSTCTMAPEENEMRISKLLDRVGDRAIVEKIGINGLKILPPVTKWKEKEYNNEVTKTLRIQPTKEVEGFYIAKIKKVVA